MVGRGGALSALWVRVVAAIALLLAAAVVSQAQIPITEYPVPTASSGLTTITAGSDGNLWFVEGDANKIGRITTAGVMTEFPVPTTGGGLYTITAGPDGNLWVTDYFGQKIWRITTAGVSTGFPVPTSGSFPFGITAGPDGNLWFTERFGNNIGRITTAGVTTEFPLPPGSSEPLEITAGPDGNLWFTEGYANKIGRITTDGVMTEFPILTGSSYPEGIITGPDGNLWFAEAGANKIGRITTDGVIREFPIPTSGGPFWITAGPDGNLWFTEDINAGNQIGRITTAGVITMFSTPTASYRMGGITAGPDGNLWFAEASADNIGKVLVTIGIAPAHGDNTGSLTATVVAPGLQTGATVKLATAGQPDIVGANPSAVHANTMTVTFDLTGATPGPRDVVITQRDGTMLTLAQGFTIEQGGCTPPPPDLVSWWPGDGNPNDIISSNNGTWVGTPAYGSGEVGQALSFNGASSVFVGNPASLHIPGPMTVEAWVNPNGVNTFMVILDQMSSSHNLGEVQLRINPTGTFEFFRTDSQGSISVEDISTHTRAVAGIWQHVVAVYDGSAYQVYINGRLDPSSGPGLPSRYNGAVTPATVIGTNKQSPTEAFNGLIDEVSIYNRALSASEVQAIFHAGRAGKCKGLGGPFPDHGGNTGTLTLSIVGIGIPAGSSAELICAGQPDILGTNTSVSPGGTTLTTTFDLRACLKSIKQPVV